MIKKSNAEVYDGKYKKSTVALKRISKSEFRLNEIKSIIKLVTRPETGSTCKSCEQEKCENIIAFHGCYEKDEFVWIVMERAKEDFKDFQFSNHNMKLKILLDTVKGLECLHANTISHLDIKPGNVLVVERNGKHVGCLADFGESIEAIKKTFTRSKIRGTDVSVLKTFYQFLRNLENIIIYILGLYSTRIGKSIQK
jgi:serine/threonine protein kinase